MPPIIRLRSWPAGPTKGSPWTSSSAPGASPTNMIAASRLPTPRTTFLPGPHLRAADGVVGHQLAQGGPAGCLVALGKGDHRGRAAPRALAAAAGAGARTGPAADGRPLPTDRRRASRPSSETETRSTPQAFSRRSSSVSAFRALRMDQDSPPRNSKQLLDVLAKHVEFQVDRVARAAGAQVRNRDGVGDDPHGEGVAVHLGNRERNAVDGDAALVDQEPAAPRGAAHAQPVVGAAGLEGLDHARPVDVARDKMPAEPAVGPHAALQVDGRAGRQGPEVRQPPRLLEHVEGRPRPRPARPRSGSSR